VNLSCFPRRGRIAVRSKKFLDTHAGCKNLCLLVNYMNHLSQQIHTLPMQERKPEIWDDLEHDHDSLMCSKNPVENKGNIKNGTIYRCLV